MCNKREESANQMRKWGWGLSNGKEDAQHRISTHEMRTTNGVVSTTSDYQTHRVVPHIQSACLEKGLPVWAASHLSHRLKTVSGNDFFFH